MRPISREQLPLHQPHHEMQPNIYKCNQLALVRARQLIQLYIDTQWHPIHTLTKTTVTLTMPRITATHMRSSMVLAPSWVVRCPL
jgi:hypothetical protein